MIISSGSNLEHNLIDKHSAAHIHTLKSQDIPTMPNTSNTFHPNKSHDLILNLLALDQCAHNSLDLSKGVSHRPSRKPLPYDSFNLFILCALVSVPFLQSTHSASLTTPHINNLSLVGSLLCKAIHKMNLHLGLILFQTKAFQGTLGS